MVTYVLSRPKRDMLFISRWAMERLSCQDLEYAARHRYIEPSTDEAAHVRPKAAWPRQQMVVDGMAKSGSR